MPAPLRRPQPSVSSAPGTPAPAPGPGQGQRAPEPAAPTRRPGSLCAWTLPGSPLSDSEPGQSRTAQAPFPGRHPGAHPPWVMPLRPELPLWELSWRRASLPGFCRAGAPDGQVQPALTLLGPPRVPQCFLFSASILLPWGLRSSDREPRPGLMSRPTSPGSLLSGPSSGIRLLRFLSQAPLPISVPMPVGFWGSLGPCVLSLPSVHTHPLGSASSSPSVGYPACSLSPGILDGLWPLLCPLSASWARIQHSSLLPPPASSVKVLIPAPKPEF